MLRSQLRYRVTLQAPTDTTNVDRTVSRVWADSATDLPAAISTSGGREFYQARSVQAELTHEVTIDWRSGVAPGQRIKLDDPWEGTTRYFDVKTVFPDDRHRYLYLFCTEILGKAPAK